jgi:hypothetical protein
MKADDHRRLASMLGVHVQNLHPPTIRREVDDHLVGCARSHHD